MRFKNGHYQEPSLSLPSLTVSNTPPWRQSEPQICLSLTKLKKRTAQILKSMNKLLEIASQHQNFTTSKLCPDFY